MKIALVYPPTCDPTAPYLAVLMLTGFLRAHGVEVLPVDANVEAYDALLRRAPPPVPPTAVADQRALLTIQRALSARRRTQQLRRAGAAALAVAAAFALVIGLRNRRPSNVALGGPEE